MKWSESHLVVSDFCNPMGYIIHEILQARKLEGFSQPRNRTQVSHIAGKFFISWATREAHNWSYVTTKLKNILPVVTTWIDHEDIKLSEINLREKDKCYMTSLTP